MPNRTAKFASAIFAGLLAGTPLTTISHSAAARRRSAFPARTTKRLGAAIGTIVLIAPPNAIAGTSETRVNSFPRPIRLHRRVRLRRNRHQRRSVRSPTLTPNYPGSRDIEQPRRDRLVPAVTADAAVGEINPDVKPPVAEGQQPNLVSRWLGRSDADPSNNPIFLTSPTPLAGPLPNGSVPISPVANKDDPDTNASAVPPTQPSPAAGQFAAADLSSPTHSVQMLLAAILGALALAGVMGRTIFKFVGPRSPAKRKGRNRRRAIWKSTDGGRTTSNAYPGADALPPRPDFPRDLDQVDDPGDRIAELLRDFSRKGRKSGKTRQPSPT